MLGRHIVQTDFVWFDIETKEGELHLVIGLHRKGFL